ncbi:hypothetical protein PC129_g14225 [Phytophthora cactorum]|uniref:Uncharacterized protein n=1 Tax=Phytophthora cactorum TaxID=29920 RepID=A0A329RTU5_9STRA|nr:hypothetical protein Pcac1_g8853 [Phytophthora cactorum]KAG2811137.1 hypothetical protein PC112_g15738 [Phytophthora cactorum]KAG2812136.1 hypothetical protein PC111_g14936 [Phytophthora cactorum]KAG2851564.1 hypothetical protein PC113_g15791 [Phytophthora cactorum]KAG2890224.1 hypothetical protein PC114_g17569 [Phytophthora cactorum]
MDGRDRWEGATDARRRDSHARRLDQMESENQELNQHLRRQQESCWDRWDSDMGDRPRR